MSSKNVLQSVLNFLELSSAWYPAIVNSPAEIPDLVNLFNQPQFSPSCLLTLIGGSTNLAMYNFAQTFNFSDYIPDSSGKWYIISTEKVLGC